MDGKMDFTKMLDDLKLREQKCEKMEKKMEVYDAAFAKIEDGISDILRLREGIRIAVSTGQPDRRCGSRTLITNSVNSDTSSESGSDVPPDTSKFLEMAENIIPTRPSWLDNPEEEIVVREKHRSIRGMKENFRCPNTLIIDGGYEEDPQLRPNHNSHMYVWDYRKGMWVWRFMEKSSPVFKTALCRDWELGNCKNEPHRCGFAHGEKDIRQKKQYVNLIRIDPKDRHKHCSPPAPC
jgi:hypothetical protein